jgi:hypothetical protein
MLQSTLKRNASLDELRRRKQEYDDAMVDWGTMVQSNLFMIRKISNAARYSELEDRLERELTPAFADVDSCLTDAFDARERQQSVEAVFKDCHMSARMQREFRASYVVTSKLFAGIATAAPTQ